MMGDTIKDIRTNEAQASLEKCVLEAFNDGSKKHKSFNGVHVSTGRAEQKIKIFRDKAKEFVDVAFSRCVGEKWVEPNWVKNGLKSQVVDAWKEAKEKLVPSPTLITAKTSILQDQFKRFLEDLNATRTPTKAETRLKERMDILREALLDGDQSTFQLCDRLSVCYSKIKSKTSWRSC